MRNMFVAATLIALSACSQSDGGIAVQNPQHFASDTFRPARDGKLLCTSPNETRKTCGSMTRFTSGPGGAIYATVDVLRNPDPLIASSGPAPLILLSDGFCGNYHSADADRFTFTIDGAPASPERTASIRADLRSRPDPEQGCLHFPPSSTQTMPTIDGASHPELAERIIWISADAGYTIGWPPS